MGTTRHGLERFSCLTDGGLEDVLTRVIGGGECGEEHCWVNNAPTKTRGEHDNNAFSSAVTGTKQSHQAIRQGHQCCIDSDQGQRFALL